MNNKLDVPKIIDSLVKLQSVAEEAYHLEIDSEKLDKAFQNEKELCEKLKVQCDDLNTKITELEDENKESQATIDGYLEDIQKIKDKEKMVKTQREYVALDTEQSLKREEIVVLEKAIGTKNKEIDTLKASLEQSKSDLEKQENLLSEKKDEVALRKVEIDDKMREIVRVREEVTPHLDQETLSRFNFIVKNKDGVGIVPVISGICEGCNIAITPQLMSHIKKNEEIVYCTNCARILYLPRKTSIF